MHWIKKFRQHTGRYENYEFISDLMEFSQKESEFWAGIVNILNNLPEDADLEDIVKVLPVYADTKMQQYFK